MIQGVAVASAVGAVLVATADPRIGRLRRVMRSSPHPSSVDALERVARRAVRRDGISADAMRRIVVDVAEEWAGLVQSGRPPVPALVDVMSDGPALISAAAEQIRLGADPIPVLMALSTRRGAEGLRALAACWRISERSGAVLSAPARRVAEALRDDLAVRLELQAQTAAPKATARLLVLLPLAGPLLGALVGADTVGVLLGSSVGRMCLVVGVLLDLLGLWWVRRIVRTAVPS